MSGATITYGAFSDFLERALLHHVFAATPYTSPTGLWVALYKTIATDAAPGEEPSAAAGYARQPVVFVDAPDPVDGSSAMWNSVLLQFPVATAAWGTLVWAGVHDAATGGNMLAHGQLAAVKVVEYGDAVRFPANEFLIGLQ